MPSLPLEKMLDYHPVIYCVIDRSNQFRHVNRTVAAVLGYSIQELLGRCFLDFIPEPFLKKTKQTLQELHQGHFIKEFENCFYNKEGTPVTMLWSAQWDPEEQLLYCIGHKKGAGQQDIVQQLAYKVKQFNAKLSETYDRVTDGICILDETFRFTYINSAASTILGLSKTDVLAQSLWELFPCALGTNIEHSYKRCYEQQVQVQFEAYYPQPLNKWFDITAYPAEDGITVFFRDITDRKTLDAEMYKLSLVVRHTNNLVLLCDMEGRIKWANKAFERKTGYTLEEVLGKRPGDVLTGPDTDQQVLASLSEQCWKGEPFHGELLYYTKSGEKLWVDVSGQIINDEKGAVKELFTIQTDITERKQLEAQLKKERELRLRQLTAAVIRAQEKERSEIGKELHDNVNQLLTTAKLYLEVNHVPDAKKKELIQKSVGILQEAISEIRDLSRRLSAPTVEQTTLEESITEIAEKVAACSEFQLKLDCSGIRALEVPEEQHLALYRIVQEHLTNIMKHAAARHVQIVLSQEGKDLVLRISDDGKGFVLKQKRNGIGIINMQSRVDNLNGSFRITTAPGKGCLLEVRLPLTL